MSDDRPSDPKAVDPDQWPDKAHRIKQLEEALRYLVQAPELEGEVSIYTARVLKTVRLILEQMP